MKISNLLFDFFESEFYQAVPIVLTASATILKEAEDLKIPYNLSIDQAVYLAALQSALKITTIFIYRTIRWPLNILDVRASVELTFRNIYRTSLQCSLGILSAKVALTCCQRKFPQSLIYSTFLTVASIKTAVWLKS